MILFFDTETTGVPKKYNAPVTDLDNWPRLVQLGYIVFHEDGTPAGAKEYIIRPDGFTIPEEASAVHGITTEMAMSTGVSLNSVIMEFGGIVKACDLIIGHNIEFDMNVMGAEFHRVAGRNPLEGKKTICTMKAGTEFCKLPKTTTRGSDLYKWPKLHELYYALFGYDMGAAHTALQDIGNTAVCYFEMKSRGIIE